ncbi:MAG: RNA polymerase sigma factor [Magnetococcales bacterium]|nr:RNA polymerase sigma factor [Magnetococcales bacterium]
MSEQVARRQFVFSGNDPDAEDVATVLSGKSQHFSVLVERFQLRIFRFLLRQGLSEHDAEDVAQETFIEAHRKLHAFRGDSKFSTWLMGIAFNMARSFKRRAPNRRMVTVPDEMLSDQPHPGASPAENATSSARIQAIKEGMDAHLSPDLKEALTLVSLEGMTYEEAAKVAGVAINTLKTRVFRARKRLRNGLEETGKLELFNF